MLITKIQFFRQDSYYFANIDLFGTILINRQIYKLLEQECEVVVSSQTVRLTIILPINKKYYYKVDFIFLRK